MIKPLEQRGRPRTSTPKLADVLAICPELHAGADHVRAFADLRVQADNLPALHSLVTDLRRDLDAVTAGLTMTWSSGPVAGAVNRIKTIK